MTTESWNLLLNIATLMLTGVVSLLVRHSLTVLQDIKKLVSRVDRMEVKVDTMWEKLDFTDPGLRTLRTRMTDFPVDR